MKRPAAEQLGRPAPGHGKVAAFFCMEDAGHINPLVALAEALVTRGHAVHFFAPVTCREKVEGSGAVWCHYGAEDWELFSQAHKVVQEQFKEEPDWELRSMPYAVLPATIGVLPWLLARMGQLRPDFIVHDSAVPWGMAVGQLLRIPAICSMTALPQALAEREQTANRWKSRKNLDTSVEVLRRAYGIEYNAHHTYTNYQPFTVVWSTRSWHKGHAEFPPEQFRYWGPLVSERKGLSLPQLPPDGRPLVFVSLGTIVTGDAFRRFGTMVQDFYPKVLQAAAQMPEVRFLLATGKHESLVVSNGTLLGQQVPENVTALARVDQLAALQVASAFITHCGQNSCSEAILNGVPVVALPIFSDQPDNAERFEELGCAVYLSYHRDPATGKRDVEPTLDRVTTDLLVAAVRKVLNEPSYREAMLRLQKAQEDERGPGIDAKLEELLRYVEGESPKRILP